MSGLVLLHAPRGDASCAEGGFIQLNEDTARLKGFTDVPSVTAAPEAAVAKFDTPSTLHRGVQTDPASGSWIAAVGTVMYPDAAAHDGGLEPLLRDYLGSGASVLSGVDGVFGLVVYDGRRRELIVVSDPFGFAGLYYTRIGERTYAGTSALALARLRDVSLNEFAARGFLATGCLFGANTLFNEVHRILPGRVVTLGSERPREKVYWRMSPDRSIGRLPFDEAVDLGVEKLERVFSRALGAESRVWIDLTGGFDTRLLAMVVDRIGHPFRANCVGTASGVDPRIAEEISRRMDWEYERIDFPEDWAEERLSWLPQALGAGDGQLDALHLANVLWTHQRKVPAAGAAFRTLLNGLGGELWRGAFWRQEFRSLGRRREVNYDRILDFRVMNPIDPRIWRTSGRLPWLRKKLIAEFEAVGNLYPDDLNVVKLDAIFAFKMIGHTGAYMSASLPLLRGLAPLFMKESIRAAISIDYRWRNHSQLVRGMLEKHRPALAALRTSWGGPATRIRLRCAHRFLPYGAFWARRLVQRVGRKAIGHPIWPEPPVEFFPTFRWRQAALRHADREGLLLPEKMRAGMLFEEEGLQALRNRAERETFGEDALLGRILTLEMAMREAAATLRSS